MIYRDLINCLSTKSSALCGQYSSLCRSTGPHQTHLGILRPQLRSEVDSVLFGHHQMTIHFVRSNGTTKSTKLLVTTIQSTHKEMPESIGSWETSTVDLAVHIGNATESVSLTPGLNTHPSRRIDFRRTQMLRIGFSHEGTWFPGSLNGRRLRKY